MNSWNSSHYLHLSAQPRCWGGGCRGLIKSHLETPDYTLINKIRLPSWWRCLDLCQQSGSNVLDRGTVACLIIDSTVEGNSRKPLCRNFWHFFLCFVSLLNTCKAKFLWWWVMIVDCGWFGQTSRLWVFYCLWILLANYIVSLWDRTACGQGQMCWVLDLWR